MTKQELAQLKNQITQLTGIKVNAKNNGSFITISNAESHAKSFGFHREVIKSNFNVTRFDGLSFDVIA